MEIRIDSLEMLYDFLILDAHRSLPGEDWREEANAKKIPLRTFIYTPISLPEPLDDLNVSFKKIGGNYSCIVPIDSFDSKVFDNTYQDISEALKELDYTFLKKRISQDDSIGAIYNPSGINTYCVQGANEGFMRIITMGTGGAYTLELPDTFDRFEKEVRSLEKIVNIFLDCFFYSNKEREDIAFLEDKVKYINP